MMRKGFPLLLLLMTACATVPSKSAMDSVDPFIGTGGDGHTYPGATSPSGRACTPSGSSIWKTTRDRTSNGLGDARLPIRSNPSLKQPYSTEP